MKTINLFKAQSFTFDGPAIDPLTINIHKTLPQRQYADLDEWRATAMAQAKTLCDALNSALPQGVVDALLVCLLDHRRSLFITAAPGAPK